MNSLAMLQKQILRINNKAWEKRFAFPARTFYLRLVMRYDSKRLGKYDATRSIFRRAIAPA